VFRAWQENKIIMKKTALFLFMLFTFVAKAQEIFLIGESNKNVKYYIYPKTVRESERPGYITAWFLSEHSVPQKSPNNKYYMKLKTQTLINCKYNKMGVIVVIAYSKNDVIVYDSGSINEYLVEAQAVIPESIGERVIKAACTFYNAMPDENQE